MRKMADSDLFMLCDEDDLEACQGFTDFSQSSGPVVQSGNSATLPAQPDGTTSEETSATTYITNQPVPLATAPAVTLLPNAIHPNAVTLLPNAIQPNVAAGGTLGRTIYITTQTKPGQPLANSMNLGPSFSYVLNRQPFTFLNTAQAPQFIAPNVVTSGSTAQPVPPVNISTVQIPVTLTLCSPTNLKSITSVAPGLTPLSIAPSSVLPPRVIPTTTPRTGGPTVKVIKFTKVNVGAAAPAAAGQVVSPPVQLTKAVTIPNITTTRAQTQTTRPQAQNPAPPPVTVTNVFNKRDSSLPIVCVHCRFIYQKNESLRGYFCQCNQELIKSIQHLTAKTKKRSKRLMNKTHPPPSTSNVSTDTSLQNVTTSEIPEGMPSPSSGDIGNQPRVIMSVEDFFYGQHPGRHTQGEANPEPVMMKCQLCDKKLKGNIKLMNHMKQHMQMDYQTRGVDCHIMCQYCYRNFSTPFSLQRHLEAVHSQVGSSRVCKICECSFETELLLLNHMKQTHKPGEMPYRCQVCEFHSSFYQDVIAHFTECHKDTANLMCLFCLKVFKSCNGFQLHIIKHQKTSVAQCDKCRLQFLFPKEKAKHLEKFHRTFVRPKQLEDLRSCTKVTIRAYASNKHADSTDNRDRFGAPLMNTPTTSEPNTFSKPSTTSMGSQTVNRTVIPTKKKYVESMVELMVKLEKQCEPTEKHFCVECNSEIPYFSNHFPSYVRCSLCRYHTCCSRAYANHMISVHVPRKSTHKYITLYKPCPKKGQLSCSKCKFKTQIGDLMAKHLVDNPSHQATRCTMIEGFSHGYKRFVFIPINLIQGGQRHDNGVHLNMQVESSFLLSSKPLSQPSYTIKLPPIPARTPSLPIQVQPIKQSTVPDTSKSAVNGELSKGNQVETGHPMEKSLTIAQLKVVLYALCCGVPQAANQFGTQPEEVQSLLLNRQRQLEPLRSTEGLTSAAADRLVEWVLCQREQQLPIDEFNLFSKASEFMSSTCRPNISYDWVVDFLLRHDLGLQAFATSSKSLPPKSQELERSFNCFLKQQVRSQTFRLSAIGAMDELSIFIDMERLDKADSSSMMSAFKLMGATAPLIDVVFTALADGTMLSTMLFLRGEPLGPDAPSMPDFIILAARPQGFTDEERLQLWLDKVWQPHINPRSGGKGLLIMDSYRGHLADEFMAALNSASTLPSVIPCSCCGRLQPLEASTRLVLCEFLHARWSQHVTTAPQDLVGAKLADLAVMLSGWLVEVLDILKAEPKLLFRSFDRVLSTNPEATSEEPSELLRSLTEALIASKMKDDEAKQQQSEEKAESSSIGSPNSWPSPTSSILALKKIFEKDSDLESFHGFEESEMMDH